MILDNVLSTSMQALPGCGYAAYIDLELGMILASVPPDFFDADGTEALAVAAANLFEGRHLQAVEILLMGDTDALEPEHFHEAITISERHLHLFLRLPDNPGHLVCYVCDKTGSAEAIMIKARASLDAYAGLFQAG